MGTTLTKRDCIFSRWDSTDDGLKQVIFNEFRMHHRGCYTAKDLLDFLEKKLLKASEQVMIAKSFTKSLGIDSGCDRS